MNTFSDYNKGSNRGALMGNWVEEEALRKTTGHSRYKGWTNGNTQLTRGKKKEDDKTYQRVLTHSEAEDPKNYEASSKLPIPKKHPDMHIPSSLGPRQQRKLVAMYETAKDLEIREGECQSTSDIYVTTTKGDYTYDSTYLSTFQRSVPRGKGGGTLSTGAVCRDDQRQIDEQVLDAHKLTNTPVTIYSHCMMTGKNMNFAISSTSGDNPFGRSTAFTNDIHNPLQRHAESTDPGPADPVFLGLTIHQRSIIEKLQTAIRLAGNSGIHNIKELLLKSDVNGNKKLSKEELRLNLSSCRIELSSEEITQIFHYFDRDGSGEIDIHEFVDSIRIPFRSKRKALVSEIFQDLDIHNDGFLSDVLVLQRYQRDAVLDALQDTKYEKSTLVKSLLKYPPGISNTSCPETGGSISVKTWNEYYQELSSWIDEDEIFKQLVKISWDLTV